MATSIILVRPQLGENIGAVARAMFNFGFDDLRLVSPRDGWPNLVAERVALKAENVVKNAKIYNNIYDSLADRDYVLATTARNRYMNKPCILSRNIKEFSNRNLAILFGAENNGLENSELSLANAIVSIPVYHECSSINLAQAVAICCYEIFNEYNKKYINEQEFAMQEEIHSLFYHLEDELNKKNFFKVLDKKPGMIQNLRNILMRINDLTSQDVRTLRGVIRSLTDDSLRM